MSNRQGKNVLTTAIAVLLAFAAVLYASCKKDETTQPKEDKCSSVVCQNQGSCINGICYCTAGYEGEKCDKASVSRYIGSWDVTETINGSSKAANRGKVNLYVLRISKGAYPLDILIDNFMGMGYNNIKGTIGRKYGAGTLVSDVVTKYILNANQTISGTYITITQGGGSINDVGTEMNCFYYLQYLDAGVIVNDTVSFIASYKQ